MALHTVEVRPVTAAVPTAHVISQPGRAHWLQRVTSAPALAVAFALTVVLAAGPLRAMDLQLHGHWVKHTIPALQPFVQDVLDRIAGQAVCLPVLALVAIVLAVRRRSWRPLAVAALAEAAFYIGVGGLKILLARSSPVLKDPGFFGGGFPAFGDAGMSFPSGHAAEAVLVYGCAAHLIARYGGVSRRVVVTLRWVVGAIAVNSSVVSLALGWHWATDLIAGLISGGLFLRLVIAVSERGTTPWFPPCVTVPPGAAPLAPRR